MTSQPQPLSQEPVVTLSETPSQPSSSTNDETHPMPNPIISRILPDNEPLAIPDGEFVVYGVVYTYPAHSDKVEELYRLMTEHTKVEEGIVYYCLSRDLDDRSVFHFFERYVSKEAFERHNETELVKELLGSGWLRGVSARFGKGIGG